MNTPILWDLFDTMSRETSKLIGIDYDSIPLNMGYGLLGAIATATAISKEIIKFTPEKYQKHLPVAFNVLEKATLGAPFIYALIEPNAKTYIQNHPVYLAGSATGTVTASQIFRHYGNETKKKLEEKVHDYMTINLN